MFGCRAPSSRDSTSNGDLIQSLFSTVQIFSFSLAQDSGRRHRHPLASGAALVRGPEKGCCQQLFFCYRRRRLAEQSVELCAWRPCSYQRPLKNRSLKTAFMQSASLHEVVPCCGGGWCDMADAFFKRETTALIVCEGAAQSDILMSRNPLKRPRVNQCPAHLRRNLRPEVREDVNHST